MAGGADGGDLGEIADAGTLVARARPALATGQSEGSEPAPTGGAAAGAPAPVAGVAGSTGSSSAPPGPTPKVVGTRPCETEARAARPDLGTVVYFATGRVQGTPVIVLGFSPAPSPGPVTLLALAQAEGCRIVLEAAGP